MRCSWLPASVWRRPTRSPGHRRDDPAGGCQHARRAGDEGAGAVSRIIRVHSAKGAVYARIMEAMMLPGSDEPMYAVIDTVDVPEGLDQAGAVAYFRSQGWEVQEDVGGDFDHPEWVEAGRSAVVKTCPDCAAVPQGNRIAHVDTCPIGRGIDEICADDRAFFEANPGATERRRSPHWAEGADLKVMGYMVDAPGEWAGEVVVRPIAEGVRARDLSGVFFVPSGVPEGWERPQMPEVGRERERAAVRRTALRGGRRGRQGDRRRDPGGVRLGGQGADRRARHVHRPGCRLGGQDGGRGDLGRVAPGAR